MYLAHKLKNIYSNGTNSEITDIFDCTSWCAAMARQWPAAEDLLPAMLGASPCPSG
jgi:hypothetical protein